MQKKRLSAMLKKAARLLKMPPVLVSKVRRSMKTRSMKKFMLLRHYNYGFVREYQFSPSNSPLIHQYYRSAAAKKRWYQDFDSVWSKKTASLVRGGGGERARPLMRRLREPEEEEEEEDGEDDSIDERAEKFIERFYEEIRIQRQRSSSSLVQYKYNPFILDMD